MSAELRSSPARPPYAQPVPSLPLLLTEAEGAQALPRTQGSLSFFRDKRGAPSLGRIQVYPDRALVPMGVSRTGDSNPSWKALIRS